MQEDEDKSKDLLYVGIGQASATLLGTAFWLVLAFVLHPTAYGHLAWLVSIASLASTVTVLGLGKTVAIYYPKEDDKELISSSVSAVVLASLIGATATALGLHYLTESPFPAFVFTLIVSLSIFSLAFYTELGKKEYGRYMWLWVGARSSGLFLPLLLYHFLGSVAAILAGLAASYLIFGSWVLGYIKEGFNFEKLKKKAYFSGKAWAANLGRASLNFLDKILIGILFPGMAVLGVYQFSFRIFALLGIVPNTLFFYLLPEKSSGSETRKIEATGFLISVVLATTVFLLAPTITSHVFPNFSEGITTVRIMALAVIPGTLARMKSSERFSEESSGTVLFSRLFGLTIGITGIITTFIADLGLVGLALSMFLLQTGIAIGLFTFPELLGRGMWGKCLLASIAIVLMLALLLSSLNIVAPRTSVEGGYLFTVEGESAEEVLNELDNENLGPATRKVFREKGHKLNEAKVTQPDEGKWHVTDEDEFYRIELEGGMLNVYRKNEIRKTDPMVMDTVAEIRVLAYDTEKAEEAIDEAFEEIYRIEDMMDSDEEGSYIYRLNNAGTEWTELSPETAYVLEKSKEYARITNGSFDVTAKPLVDFWMKEVRETGEMPEEEDLEQYRELVDSEKLVVDGENNRARLKEGDMEVTLGGIAKGYAVDRAVEVLIREGLEEILVDIGGDIRAEGNKTWTTGITDPRTEGEILETITIRNEAISTSGDYRRYHLLGDQRIHHIIDPKSGRPAKECMSVSVIHNNSLGADALSTGVFVAGPEEGMEILNVSNSTGLIVDGEGNITTTDSWN